MQASRHFPPLNRRGWKALEVAIRATDRGPCVPEGATRRGGKGDRLRTRGATRSHGGDRRDVPGTTPRRAVSDLCDRPVTGGGHGAGPDQPCARSWRTRRSGPLARRLATRDRSSRSASRRISTMPGPAVNRGGPWRHSYMGTSRPGPPPGGSTGFGRGLPHLELGTMWRSDEDARWTRSASPQDGWCSVRGRTCLEL